jgi:hypothetical protein
MLSLLASMASGQGMDPFFNNYSFVKSFYPEKARVYKDIDGSPYMNSEFEEGMLYLSDTTKITVPLRYNIYSDEMEYQLKGVNYAVGNPKVLKKIMIGRSVFLYLPFIQKGNYFELLEPGKCMLVQKKSVRLNPAQAPRAILTTPVPASFERKNDVNYIVNDQMKFLKIDNMKSLLTALQDQKLKIDNYIKQEKIRNTKTENLIKIVKYYNSL